MLGRLMDSTGIDLDASQQQRAIRPAAGMWPWLLACYLAGVLAAAQIGKFAALAPPMVRELGLGLPTMAVLIALIEAGGSLLGVRAGRAAQRFGLARSMIVALLLLAMASFGESRAEGAPALIAWRLIEAIGYVGVVVSAPVLIANRAGPRLAPVLLTVWSTFVPVGLAVGAWGHGAVADAAGWRAATQASAAAALLLALASIAAYRSSGERADLARPAAESTVDGPMAPAAWYLAAAFGGFATLGIGVLALLPTVLAAQGLGVAEAGRWTAWASFATVPGSLFIALIVRRPAWHRPLVALALLLPALLMFVVFGASMPAATVGFAALLLNAALGLFGGLAFALLPQIAGGPQRTAQAYGALAQFGATGSLAGPPLLAAVAAHAGWAGAAWLGCGLAVLSLPLALRALRRR
ncbi:MAG TPA: MFS transporter [Burkholderiaceae bacterium]